MKQCGLVTEVEGAYAKVIMQRHTSCSSCNACKMGHENHKVEIRGLNNAKAKVGQWVSVDMDNHDVLMAAFIVYVIPLIALIAGIMISNAILSSTGIGNYQDLVSAAIGFIAMAITFLIIRTKEKNFSISKRYLPVITEVVDITEQI